MAPIAAGRFKAKHVRGGCSWIAEPLPRVYYTRGYFHRVLRMTQGGSSISSDAAAADDAGLDFRELTEPQMVQLEYADTLVSDQIANKSVIARRTACRCMVSKPTFSIWCPSSDRE
jgi:hypothetical protein